MNIFKTTGFCLILLLAVGCRKQNNARLYVKIKFDPLQERLNNQGLSTGIGAGNAAQTPAINHVGIEGLEILKTAFSKAGEGSVLFSVPKTNAGGSAAVDYSKLITVKDGDVFLSTPVRDIAPGKYEWLRASVACHNFDLRVNMINIPFVGNLPDERAAFAGFLGTNNYITKYKVWEKEDVVNGNKGRGYWCMETKFNAAFNSLNTIYRGQMTDKNITFVNPISQTVPTLTGSADVVGRFETPLSITGAETEDITVVLTLSTNNMFEWEENINRNGKWDINAQGSNGQPEFEKIKDIGFRGLKVAFQSK
jgi:hypothetical protein